MVCCVGDFVVHAEWLVRDGVATTSDQSLLADGLAAGDPCVWVEETRPAVVLASFDVEAPDLESALREGRESVVGAAKAAGVAGHLARLTAMDEEGFLDWP